MTHHFVFVHDQEASVISVLSYAAYLGNRSIVQVLLQRGCPRVRNSC